jgi:hypothetical protein
LSPTTDVRDFSIFRTTIAQREEIKANARLIVIAVNAFDELVGLCNELIEIIKFGKSIGDRGLTEIITNAQKILASAQEEKK